MNRSQVSTDDYQMSTAGGMFPGLMSGGVPRSDVWGGGGKNGEGRGVRRRVRGGMGRVRGERGNGGRSKGLTEGGEGVPVTSMAT